MSKRVAAVAVLLAVGLGASACAFLYKPQDRFFTVVVWQAEGGPCRVVAVTPAKDGFAVRKDLVHWDVVGNCTATVGIGRFTLRGGPGASPWEGPDGERVAKPGTRANDRVKADAEPGAYEYSIFIDGRLALDPEIQIKGRP